jgi:NADH:ubiquinone oxidoreductase subunit 5 (subunit L)/multisubunit Na+/H+ antiporter MnhA subunit
MNNQIINGLIGRYNNEKVNLLTIKFNLIILLGSLFLLGAISKSAQLIFSM